MNAASPLIIVRGAGDIATGTIHRLAGAGLRVLALESEKPSAIRRQVAFSEAVYDGTAAVEGRTAVLVRSKEDIQGVWNKGLIPLAVDPDGTCIRDLSPLVVVDAILAKKNLGTTIDMAPLTIALGPGFTAGVDVNYVIETMRGHNLGRIISDGSAMPNTGTPGVIAGYGKERVIHSPAAGIWKTDCPIGASVEKGQIIAKVHTSDGDVPVPASLTGIVRGMIRSGFEVTEGFKVCDIDPRATEYANCFTISDKARCIAGSVLELVVRELTRR